MKKLLLFAALNFSLFTLSAQQWTWAEQGIGNLSVDDEGYGVALDNKGNIFLTGSFQYNIKFGTYQLTNPNAENNVFLAKYDSSGNILWANQSHCGLSSSGYGNFVAVDALGNSYVTGYFVDSLMFSLTTLVAPGNVTSYLVKYDALGNFVWAKQATNNSGPVFSNSVATDHLGNIYITGEFGGSVTFGSSTDTVGGVFLVKYDAIGNVIWARQSLGGSSGDGYGVTTDISGNIYITGDFRDTISFGTFKLNAPNVGNIFLVKYDPNGNVLWAKQSTNVGTYSDGIGLVTDNRNHVYLTGDFRGSITFNSHILNSSLGDVFLNKYDSLGNLIWTRQGYPENTNWTGYSVAVDTLGHVYLTGGEQGGVSTGIAFGVDTLSVTRPYEIDASILIKLDSSGNFMCGSIISSGGDDNNVVVTDPQGKHVYFGGDLWSGVKFGNDSVGTGPQVSEWPFIARWLPSCNVDKVNEIRTGKEEIRLYPNPNNGKFNIQLSTGKQSGESIVEVYNMLGEKIYSSIQLQNSMLQVDVGKQPSGLYLYRVTNTDGNPVANGKFIVE